MADIDVIYQVNVHLHNRDVFRLLWFQDDETRNPSVVNRMTVDLFDTVLSPDFDL